ncbi:hypothetical protein EVAR_86215_1 [Eumeta japonica]|uniref:Uncharacterized protein n=1 Tax=Eumeta variegata TaxID=151549 RepID=A0A4C1UBX1_EUMVA|nr:hypothetical protein EVAR_86215_1 [Eumeta japonica]
MVTQAGPEPFAIVRRVRRGFRMFIAKRRPVKVKKLWSPWYGESMYGPAYGGRVVGRRPLRTTALRGDEGIVMRPRRPCREPLHSYRSAISGRRVPGPTLQWRDCPIEFHDLN